MTILCWLNTVLDNITNREKKQHKLLVRIPYTALFALFLCSCVNNRLVKDMEKFMNQQISFPMEYKAIWNAKDTVLTDFSEVPIKLVIWYDSLGCTSCEAGKMRIWNDVVAEADSLSQWFRIIYLFTPKKEDLNKVTAAIKGDKFNYPVFIDQNATFIKQNPNLPKNRRLHSFLLDKNNRVIIVGNPLHNPTLWQFYKNAIKKMIDNYGILQH